MTDASIRKRRRAARQSKSPEDLALVLVDRIRNGEISLEQAAIAAWLGSQVARIVIPRPQDILGEETPELGLNDYRSEPTIALVRTLIFRLTRNQAARLVRYGWKLTGSSQDFGEWNLLRGDKNRVAELFDYLWWHSQSVRNREIYHKLAAKLGDLLIE